MVNCTQAPNALLTFHRPKRVTRPCLIHWAQRSTIRPAPEGNGTGLSVHGLSDCTFIDKAIALVCQPLALLAPSALIGPELQRETLAEDTRPRFLPEEEADHHSWRSEPSQ